MKKLWLYVLVAAPALAALSVRPASAQDYFGINDLRDETYLSDANLPGTIAGVINIVLSFLGILATLIILLGGFKWMTSAGNTDKVDEAKRMIGAGIVGLIIVLSSYAIARFVLEAALDNL